MKGELSGVGPVFAGVADPIGSGFVTSLARGAPAAASWRVLARRERAAAGRGAPIADCPKRARRSRPVHDHCREVAHAQDDGNRRCPWLSVDRLHGLAPRRGTSGAW
jgi:hypothetical protein